MHGILGIGQDVLDVKLDWGQSFGCASQVRVVLDLSGTFDVAAELVKVEQCQSLVVQAMLEEGRPLGAAVALTD
jgi:hypothetical protein